MKKFSHRIIIMLALGSFLLPTVGYGCGIISEKSCCNKEISFKSEKKDCCKNKKSKEQKNSCGGKCGHSNCTSSTSVYFSIVLNFEIDFKNIYVDFATKKSIFDHSKTFISSGFTSVWLPPKINNLEI